MYKKFVSSIMVLCCLLLISGTCLAAPVAPVDRQLHLVLDEMAPNSVNSVYLIDSKAMITLSSLPTVFTGNAGIESDQITIKSRNTTITMYPGRTDYIVNTVTKQADTTPLVTADNQVLIPLRVIAQELQYDIIYDAETATVYLHSPEYKQMHPATQQTTTPSAATINFNPTAKWGCIEQAPSSLGLSEQEAFVAGYYTRLPNKLWGRTTNITLSCAHIDGNWLNPGEVFSFNQTVGERTANAGYQEAGVFSGNQVVEGIGGGICQTASTLYNLALESGLQIVERHPHSLPVTYAAPGRDATVYWGQLDLKFRNTLGFPVKILCRVESNCVLSALIRQK